MEERRNPYSATLMVFALIGLITGGALYAFGAMSAQTHEAAGLLVAIGASAFGVGATFFVLWIAVSAITWSIREAARRAAAVR